MNFNNFRLLWIIFINCYLGPYLSAGYIGSSLKVRITIFRTNKKFFPQSVMYSNFLCTPVHWLFARSKKKSSSISIWYRSEILNLDFLLLFIFSSPSYNLWGNLVNMQIFDFRFLANLHVLGLENPKNTKLAWYAGVR